MRKTLIHMLGVFLITVFFIGILGFRTVSVGVSPMPEDQQGLCVTDPSGVGHEIVYKEVSDIRLISLPEDYGECLLGDCRKGFSYGTWRNSEYGVYSLCVRDSASQAICLRQDENTFIFNFEGDTSTESFYQALLEKIREYERG